MMTPQEPRETNNSPAGMDTVDKLRITGNHSTNTSVDQNPEATGKSSAGMATIDQIRTTGNSSTNGTTMQNSGATGRTSAGITTQEESTAIAKATTYKNSLEEVCSNATITYAPAAQTKPVSWARVAVSASGSAPKPNFPVVSYVAPKAVTQPAKARATPSVASKPDLASKSDFPVLAPKTTTPSAQARATPPTDSQLASAIAPIRSPGNDKENVLDLVDESVDEDDDDLKAAIAASLIDMKERKKKQEAITEEQVANGASPQSPSFSGTTIAGQEEPRATDASATTATPVEPLATGDLATVTTLENPEVTGRSSKYKRRKEAARKRKGPANEKAEEEEKLLNQLVAERKAELAPRWEIRDSVRTGKGMFATRNIPKGSEILREAPMIICGAPWLSREALFALLPEEKKNAYMALENRCRCGEDPCGETLVQQIWETNSIPVTDAMEDGQTILYEYASRANHSCVANAVCLFTKQFEVIFWAAKDIMKDEEITREYTGAFGFAENRQIGIAKKFGFECLCEACIASEEIPDDRLKEVIELLKMIEKGSPTTTETVNKRTPEQVQAEKAVSAWFGKISQVCNDMAKLIIQNTIVASKRPGTDLKDVVSHSMQNSLKLWGQTIRDHNKLKTGDKMVMFEEEVLQKYMRGLEETSAMTMGELVDLEDKDLLYALTFFWSEVHDSLRYEFPGQKAPKHNQSWLQQLDLVSALKAMEEKSVAPKNEPALPPTVSKVILRAQVKANVEAALKDRAAPKK
ncbi:uncharacterized protein PAC_03370 [Phialocephala subalpina]|uniref:SET domain-containing protein n=1 Tax=Phialocephala subalpina TaxID=576137 RepID=A0A1L7WL45_9HELO|nr:uncharacterized protein PAC_03370 [Phialocephala subalpina]